MDNKQYLIVITLIDGQNFTVPAGAPDKIEATVFAEARFGNASVLRSDPVILSNANPEFGCELAWKISDRKILHQLRVERKAIKLQVFMQTRRKTVKVNETALTATSTATTTTTTTTTTATTTASEPTHSNSHETNQIELIGYTILDIRSADQTGKPKYKWFVLLNPKYKKPSYNRPEIQLALTLNRLDDDENENAENQTSHEYDSSNQFSSISSLPDGGGSRGAPGEQTNESLEMVANLNNAGGSHDKHRMATSDNPDGSNESSRLYRTCLEVTTNSAGSRDDEIIDNDIIIMRRNEIFYVYDNKKHKSSLDECSEHFKLIIKIPFTSNLDLLVDGHASSRPAQAGPYLFSINFFGTSFSTEPFRELVNVKPKQISIDVRTSNPATLATYFELNPDLDIRLISVPSSTTLGVTTIQLNQLSGLDMKFRCSIEGIFNIQSEDQYESHVSALTPNMGVSAHMQRVEPSDHVAQLGHFDDSELTGAGSSMGAGAFQGGEDPSLSQILISSINNTHQVTVGHEDEEEEAAAHLGNQIPAHNLNGLSGRGRTGAGLPDYAASSTVSSHAYGHNHARHGVFGNQDSGEDEVLIEDYERPGQDDHHFCFTIDIMRYSYTTNRVFSRELIFRYSYPFFGYKDPITTEQSIPISKTSSIIVSGFCEFNFATNSRELSVAFRQLPLDLEILAGDQDLNDQRQVATCRINIAKLLGITGDTVECSEAPLSSTSSVPIYALNGDEIGEVQILLAVKDLGLPAKTRDGFNGSGCGGGDGTCAGTGDNGTMRNSLVGLASAPGASAKPCAPLEACRVDSFIADTKRNFDSWKEESFDRLADEIRKRDDERFRRLYQRLEAKETSRSQEFERRLQDMDNLKQEFHSVLGNVKNLEKMLVDSIQHLKEKHSSLDERLERIEARLAQVCANGVPAALAAGPTAAATAGAMASASSARQDRAANVQQAAGERARTVTGGALKNVEISPRRSSLRNGVPLSGVAASLRSTSLVRRPSEGSVSLNNRLVRRTTVQLPGPAASTPNGHGARARSSSAKSNLSEEIQSLRRERAELLKRGCKPTDELIQEINSLIEKLAC